jgi:hypothetical protein
VGLAGVGGGGCGGLSRELTVESGGSEACGEEPTAASFVVGVSSVSVSEPEESKSQLSATGLDFGFEAVFWGTVAESWRLPRVSAISVKLCVSFGIVMERKERTKR